MDKRLHVIRKEMTNSSREWEKRGNVSRVENK